MFWSFFSTIKTCSRQLRAEKLLTRSLSELSATFCGLPWCGWRYRAHLKLKHFNKSLFFLSSKSQIWTYLSHECRKDKDRKRIFNLDKNILFKKGKNICTVVINQLQFHIFLNTWLKSSQSLFLNRLASPVFSFTLYFKIRSVVRLPVTTTTTWPLQQTYRTFVLQSPFSFV